MHLVGLRLEPREEALHAVPLLLPPRALAVEHPGALLGREVAPRHVRRHAALRREAHEIVLALLVALRLPRLDRAFGERLALVRDHEPPVDADRAAEAAAVLARAERRVEREAVRHDVAVRDVAVRAVAVRRVLEFARGSAPPVAQGWRTSPDRLPACLCPRRALEAGSFPRAHRHVALAELERVLQRFDDACAVRGRERDAVLDHFDLLLRARVDLRVALAREVGLDLVALEVLRDRHGERHEHARARAADGRIGRELRVDRLRVVAPHLAAAIAAVEHRGAREQELQVVVELGHRADGRARRADGVRLVDRDRGRDALDPVDLRLVHAVEELARVRRERLDVAALALGVDRVERERRLARAAHARHDDELVERQV